MRVMSGEGDAGGERFLPCVKSGQLCPRTRLRYIVVISVVPTGTPVDARSHRRPCCPLPVWVLGAAFRLAVPRGWIGYWCMGANPPCWVVGECRGRFRGVYSSASGCDLQC